LFYYCYGRWIFWRLGLLPVSEPDYGLRAEWRRGDTGFGFAWNLSIFLFACGGRGAMVRRGRDPDFVPGLGLDYIFMRCPFYMVFGGACSGITA